MFTVDLTIEKRQFAPASIALAVRTIGACAAAGHRPDGRLLCGIGILYVRQKVTAFASLPMLAASASRSVPLISSIGWSRISRQAARSSAGATGAACPAASPLSPTRNGTRASPWLPPTSPVVGATCRAVTPGICARHEQHICRACVHWARLSTNARRLRRPSCCQIRK